MSYCVKCGKKANDADNYCTKCGEKLIKKNRIELPYQFPSITLLDLPKTINKEECEIEIRQNIEKLEQVLKDFGVIAKVSEVHVGPSITIYELEVKPGTKIKDIININKEIALALSIRRININPIFDKGTIGVEIPNKVFNVVTLREVISSVPKEKLSNKLMVALGKDIMGTSRYCEIDKTPHLLISGSNGSGKSEFIKSVIASILMRARPDEVKLIIINNKLDEMRLFNGLPHLLQSVVSNPKYAEITLQKVVAEMMDRYDKFADSYTKNIRCYNEYLEKKNQNLTEESRYPLLPYIVVIIDDASSLNLEKNVLIKDSINRILEMGRSAGIHLIISSQRPSSDIITSNIKSRISFASLSKNDSKAILGVEGAEKLLGKGDMLFLPMGETDPVRIQGTYVSEDELMKIVSFICSQDKINYEESEILKDSQVSTREDDIDPLYNEVVEFVVSTGKASASLIQRRFKIGYNRAARLVDELDERGIGGPQQGSKPREILVEFSK